MKYFIFIIYFSDSLDVIAYTYNEDQCIKLFGLLSNYLGPENINWHAFSLDSILEKFVPHSPFLKGQ